MKCPSCGTYVSRNAKVCPACHAPLAHGQGSPGASLRWCRVCGSQIPEGEGVCPHCGTPYNTNPPTVAQVLDGRIGDPEVELAPEQDTRSMPRIESAIPAEPDDGYASEGTKEHLPRLRVVLATSLIAVAAVGGTMLMVTQPWNPYAYVTHALTDADTSMEGFPGLVESLTGQDRASQGEGDEDAGGTDEGAQSSGDVVFDQLESAYEQLGDLSSRIDANEATLDAVLAGDEGQREAGTDEALSLSLELSNLLSQVGSYDLSSTPYVEDQQHVVTLGNYLRNRMDALSDAWDSGSKGSADSWKALFDGAYANWAPELRSS